MLKTLRHSCQRASSVRVTQSPASPLGCREYQTLYRPRTLVNDELGIPLSKLFSLNLSAVFLFCESLIRISYVARVGKIILDQYLHTHSPRLVEILPIESVESRLRIARIEAPYAVPRDRRRLKFANDACRSVYWNTSAASTWGPGRFMHKYIICQKNGCLGSITLSSEKTLNALSLPMIAEIRAVLKQWKEDEGIACVLFQGAGEKAFCAGGDVRRLYDAIIKQPEQARGELLEDCTAYFIQEYSLDYEIHRFPKPIVVWGDGIVMGGGIGLAAGASHRVVTEKSTLAMPEIAIGLYPDVGGTWFLNKMPEGFGLFLGLTGARLNAVDCLYTGLADHFIPANLKLDVVTRLQETNWESSSEDNSAKVTTILNSISANHQPGRSLAQPHQSFISSLEKISSVRAFREALLGYRNKDEWIDAGIKGFEAGSPSSAHIIFEQLKRGSSLSLEEVFQSELNLSLQCTIHPDFAEGVRALLVDKDRSPKWQPATLEEINNSWVESYFSPLWKDDEHPLKQLGNSGHGPSS